MKKKDILFFNKKIKIYLSQIAVALLRIVEMVALHEQNL
jgi:hypothetical protein